MAKNNTTTSSKKSAALSAQDTSHTETFAQALAQVNVGVHEESIGTVSSLGDGILEVTGLDDAQAGELIDLGNDQQGLALNLN